TQTTTPHPTQPAAPTPTPTTTSGGGGGLTLDDINGFSHLLAGDNTYLGDVWSNYGDPNSICNRAGAYGSSVTPKTVRNPVGRYGSTVMPLSAYNPITFTPPAIVYGGRIVGYLTKNTAFASRVDPDVLFAYYDCT